MSQIFRTTTRRAHEKRCNDHCAFCGQKVQSGKRIRCYRRRLTATLDHLVPRKYGGTNEPTNVVLACLGCNCEKGLRSWQEYAVWCEERYGQPVVSRIERLRHLPLPREEARWLLRGR